MYLTDGHSERSEYSYLRNIRARDLDIFHMIDLEIIVPAPDTGIQRIAARKIFEHAAMFDTTYSAVTELLQQQLAAADVVKQLFAKTKDHLTSKRGDPEAEHEVIMRYSKELSRARLDYLKASENLGKD